LLALENPTISAISETALFVVSSYAAVTIIKNPAPQTAHATAAVITCCTKANIDCKQTKLQ
jgi:hypothetical protein